MQQHLEIKTKPINHFRKISSLPDHECTKTRQQQVKYDSLLVGTLLKGKGWQNTVLAYNERSDALVKVLRVVPLFESLGQWAIILTLSGFGGFCVHCYLRKYV